MYCGQCPTKLVSTEQKFLEVRLNEVAKRFKLATQSKATKQILRDDEGFRENLVDLTSTMLRKANFIRPFCSGLTEN